MNAIDGHQVQFGELAGPIVHGTVFFNWELIATQQVAKAFDYPFEQIIAEGGIPFAPVTVATSVYRYPTIEDSVTVKVVPCRVGNSSVELIYEMEDADGEPLATARMTHVTIAPAGNALPLPDHIQGRLADACVDCTPTVGPASEVDVDDVFPTFESSFPVRSPHIEGSELAYFEEYPRFAAVSLESYLEDQGTSLAELSGEKQPYRLRDWRWEFKSPVHFESTLRVESDVVTIDQDTLRIKHSLTSDGQPSIQGITEYGCFDRNGTPTTFDEAALEPLRS